MDNDRWKFINKKEVSKRGSQTDSLNSTEDRLYRFESFKQSCYKIHPELFGGESVM